MDSFILNEINNLSVPGKTFLLGEYAVLKGGSCIGFGSNPGFKIELSNKGTHFINQIHNQSAAGMFLKKIKTYENESYDFLLNVFETYEFKNPYILGGFGASTAEWVICKYLYEKVFKKNNFLNKQQELQNWFQSYQNCFLENPNKRPSGADLLIQILGGLRFIKMDLQLYYKNIGENFIHSKSYFSLISTSFKLKTHDHLQLISTSEIGQKKVSDLVMPSHECAKAFALGDFLVQQEALKEYSDRLQIFELMDPNVIQLKDFLQKKLSQKFKNIYVKPCGAMGVDVLCIHVHKDHQENLKMYFNQLINSELQLKNLIWQSDSYQTHKELF